MQSAALSSTCRDVYSHISILRSYEIKHELCMSECLFLILANVTNVQNCVSAQVRVTTCVYFHSQSSDSFPDGVKESQRGISQWGLLPGAMGAVFQVNSE